MFPRFKFVETQNGNHCGLFSLRVVLKASFSSSVKHFRLHDWLVNLDLAVGLRGVINPPEITVKLRTCRLPIQTNAINCRDFESCSDVKLTMADTKGNPGCMQCYISVEESMSVNSQAA